MYRYNIATKDKTSVPLITKTKPQTKSPSLMLLMQKQ